MGKLVKQLELDALGLTSSPPSPSVTLILIFGPCLACLFSKFLQDRLQAFTNRTIHKLTNSDYQKLQPHTNPQPFLMSPPRHPCPAGSSYRRLTLGPYSKSKRLGSHDRVHMGSH